jgi:hypothetical protein
VISVAGCSGVRTLRGLSPTSEPATDKVWLPGEGGDACSDEPSDEGEGAAPLPADAGRM